LKPTSIMCCAVRVRLWHRMRSKYDSQDFVASLGLVL
jgi:hypothetical protein